MRMSALLCGVRRASIPLQAELFLAAGLISLVLSFSSLVRCLLEHIVILFPLRDSAQCFVSWLAHTFGMSYCCPMELRHLRYFVAVAAHGSFNRAAEVLHLTQPALSRQVKDLEEELGVPLLVRGQNTVKLTESGDLFYEEAREVLARANEAVQRVRGEARNETLRLGYAPSIIAGIMSAVLERFLSTTPRVRIELMDLSSKEINELADEGRLDLVISPGISITKGISEFQWTELHRLQPVLVMPVTHPLAKLKCIPPMRLRDLPLIGLARGNYPEYVPHVRGILKCFGVSPRFVSLVND